MNYDPNTGKPINSGYQQQTSSTNGWAIAGLICSLVVGSITGLIFSFIGLASAKKCNSGKGMSIAGIIISILRILFIVFIVILFVGVMSTQTDKCDRAQECEEIGFGYKICTFKDTNGIKSDIICPVDKQVTGDRTYNKNNNTYKKVKMYVFYGQGCPHCEDLFDYLDELKYDSNYKDKFEIVKYETWHDEDNSDLMIKFAEYFDLDIYSLGVPFYIIGDEFFTGFPNPTSSQSSIDRAHNQIKQAIDKNYGNNKAIDVYESIKKGTSY